MMPPERERPWLVRNTGVVLMYRSMYVERVRGQSPCFGRREWVGRVIPVVASHCGAVNSILAVSFCVSQMHQVKHTVEYGKHVCHC